jgi:hypothetical protein
VVSTGSTDDGGVFDSRRGRGAPYDFFRPPWGLTNPLSACTGRESRGGPCVRRTDERPAFMPAKVWWHRDLAPAHTSRALPLLEDA